MANLLAKGSKCPKMDHLSEKRNMLGTNLKACVCYFLKIHYTSDLIT